MCKVFGALSFCLTMGAFLCAFAQQIDLEALARRPDFTVTKKVVNGQETVEIRKASVVITMNSQGTIGIDSGGAVLCAWHIFVELKLAADFCFPSNEAELRADLNDAIDSLKRFIVANSLTPTSANELDAFVETHRTERYSRLPASIVGTAQCPSKDVRGMLDAARALGHDGRRAEIAKLLSPPRPPVMNPCL